MATIELLTLANHAEVQNGLLYLSGAEWDTIARAFPEGGEPAPQHFSVALSVVIPWNETNIPHHVELWIEDEDAQLRLLDTSFDLETGRPPGKVPGSETRSSIALTGDIQFPSAGGYRLRARVGLDERNYTFRVIDEIARSPRPG